MCGLVIGHRGFSPILDPVSRDLTQGRGACGKPHAGQNLLDHFGLRNGCSDLHGPFALWAHAHIDVVNPFEKLRPLQALVGGKLVLHVFKFALGYRLGARLRYDLFSELMVRGENATEAGEVFFRQRYQAGQLLQKCLLEWLC